MAKTTLQREFGGIDSMRKALNLQNIDTRSLTKESFKQFQDFQSKLQWNPPNATFPITTPSHLRPKNK